MNKVTKFFFEKSCPEYYKRILRNEFESILKNTTHNTMLTIKYHGVLSDDEFEKIKPIHGALKEMQCEIYEEFLKQEVKSAEKGMAGNDRLLANMSYAQHKFYKGLLDDYNQKEN